MANVDALTEQGPEAPPEPPVGTEQVDHLHKMSVAPQEAQADGAVGTGWGAWDVVKGRR